jgi:hypothetical protein
MKQRGRRSSADLSVVAVHPASHRIQPPHDLTKDEAALFRELVASCSANHFVLSDRPLLIAYVQTVLASRHRAKASRRDPKLLAMWEKTVRMLAVLASRLKLAPSARPRHEANSRVQGVRASVYDMMREGWK